MAKIKYSDEQINQVMFLRLQDPSLTVAKLSELTGVNRAKVKRIIIANPSLHLSKEQQQENAYKGKLIKNPNAMADMRKTLTPEVVARRSDSTRKFYKDNQVIADLKSIQFKNWWKSLSEEDKKSYLDKRQKAAESSENVIRYRQSLKKDSPQENHKSAAILKAEGFSSFEERMASWAAEWEGKFIGPYINSTSLTNWKCKVESHPQFEMRPTNVREGQWCRKCSNQGSSRAEDEVYEYVKSIAGNLTVVRHYKYNYPHSKHSLDIFLPDLKFGIEYNGNIYHSSLYTKPLNGENQEDVYQRHYLKFNKCNELGIELFAFFSDEWENNKELVKKMIQHRMKVSKAKAIRAGDCEIVTLYGNVEYSDFFKKYHLEGNLTSSIGFGLKYNNELVMCISIKIDRQHKLEIARMASNYNYRIHGGASKLFKFIYNKYKTPIYSYSNNRLSNGNVYRKLGFSLYHSNTKNYWYTDGDVRIHCSKCKRENLPEILENYPTEEAQALGGIFSLKYFGDRRPLYRIEDYGNLKWVYGL